MAYVDKEQFGDELVGVYEDAGITIIPRQANDYERYRSMILDIAWWEVDMCPHNFDGKSVMVISKEIKKESLYFTYFQSIATLCQPLFYTPNHDHDPPPRKSGWLEPICFNLQFEPIDQSVTLHRCSHRYRKSRDESLYYSHKTMDDYLINPDPPVESTSSEPCTYVFWDGVDYPLPHNDPYYAYMVSKLTFEEVGFRGELSMPIKKLESPIHQSFSNKGINMREFIEWTLFCGQWKIPTWNEFPQCP